MELNLELVADKLTWHPYESVRQYDEYGYKGINLLLGAVIRDKKGELYLVGNIVYDGRSPGCGCCSGAINGIEVAYLGELLHDE